MKEFISTKRVSAEPETRDGIEGMQLVYADGYKSWCPLNVFQRDYQPLDAMSFGHALFAMQNGARVCRAGWNGKGMWLTRVGAEQYGVGIPIADVGEAHLIANVFSLTLFPWLGMKTADDKFGPWLASQTDMLADDWQVVL